MARREENPNRISISLPKGTLSWPHLNEPDYGTDKFPKKDGEYNTRVLLDASDDKVKAFTERLDELMEVSKELAEAEFAKLPIKTRKDLESKGGLKAQQPYTEEYDEDTEEPTGRLDFLAKMKAGGIRKKDNKPWSAKPALFDAQGKPFPKSLKIWGGTTAILNCTLEPYFSAGTGTYGLLRRLNAVQVIELVSEGGNRNASAYGFEAQEGFDASEVEEEVTESASEVDSAEDDDTDDANF